jgi:hypothetical protein
MGISKNSLKQRWHPGGLQCLNTVTTCENPYKIASNRNKNYTIGITMVGKPEQNTNNSNNSFLTRQINKNWKGMTEYGEKPKNVNKNTENTTLRLGLSNLWLRIRALQGILSIAAMRHSIMCIFFTFFTGGSSVPRPWHSQHRKEV